MVLDSKLSGRTGRGGLACRGDQVTNRSHETSVRLEWLREMSPLGREGGTRGWKVCKLGGLGQEQASRGVWESLGISSFEKRGEKNPFKKNPNQEHIKSTVPLEIAV